MLSLLRCTLIVSLVVLCFSGALAAKPKRTKGKNNIMKKVPKSRKPASPIAIAVVTSPPAGAAIGVPCGSRGLEPCRDGQTCIDPDLSDSCTPAADCPGICVPFCGGIAGIACPEGLTCVDDPSDSCDPKAGGADCGGYCMSSSTCPSADSWPELVGVNAGAAKALIEGQQPCLMVVVIQEGSPVTADYRLDRVRIFVDGKGNVSSVPQLG